MADRDDEERGLWGRYAARRRALEEGACPDEGALAAFLQARGDVAERARVEEHLAACPRCTAALADALRIEQAPPAAVPPALLQRLRSAVVAEAGSRRGTTAEAIGARRLAALPAWIAMAAALAVVCWTGFILGARTMSGRAWLAEQAASEASFGLGEMLAAEPEQGPLSWVEAR